jgi:hypothetical protein
MLLLIGVGLLLSACTGEADGDQAGYAYNDTIDGRRDFNHGDWGGWKGYNGWRDWRAFEIGESPHLGWMGGSSD